MEIIFSKKKHSTLNLLPPPKGVTRVDNIKILGVTIESNLLVKAHVDNVLSSCSQSLHALRILRSRSLPDNLIHNVFSATIMSKLTYCSPAWRGFMRSVETDRMNAFLRKAIKFNYCPALTPPINETLDKIDAKFFNSITTNSHHVLHHLLPPSQTTSTNFAQDRIPSHFQPNTQHFQPAIFSSACCIRTHINNYAA